jgi:hypothetical protein
MNNPLCTNKYKYLGTSISKNITEEKTPSLSVGACFSPQIIFVSGVYECDR